MMKNINVEITERKHIGVKIRGNGELPYYEGDTTVTPKIGESQTLETAYRSMRQNVTVERIPVGTVENPHGGYTVIIG